MSLSHIRIVYYYNLTELPDFDSLKIPFFYVLIINIL